MAQCLEARWGQGRQISRKERMGEYATYNGKRIKIGTCESLYYLRADQASLVAHEEGSANPTGDMKDGSQWFRFRFPFPDEDCIKPGEFDDFDRGFHVPGVVVPKGVHEDAPDKACVKKPWRRGKGAGEAGVEIVQQRVFEGKLVTVCQCRKCGELYRLPTLDDALPLIDALLVAAGEAPAAGAVPAKLYAEVCRRVINGYLNPPEWIKQAPGGNKAAVKGGKGK